MKYLTIFLIILLVSFSNSAAAVGAGGVSGLVEPSSGGGVHEQAGQRLLGGVMTGFGGLLSTLAIYSATHAATTAVAIAAGAMAAPALVILGLGGALLLGPYNGPDKRE